MIWYRDEAFKKPMCTGHVLGIMGQKACMKRGLCGIMEAEGNLAAGIVNWLMDQSIREGLDRSLRYLNTEPTIC